MLWVAAAVLVAVWWWRRGGRARRLLAHFPGDLALPVLGNALQMGIDSEETCSKLMEMWKRHGKQNFRVAMGSETWILLSNPDDVQIMLSHPTELSKPYERNAAMIPFFGNSVSSSEGERWRAVRKMITSCFHYKTVDSKLETMNELCERMIMALEKQKGNLVDVYRYLKPYLLDVICSTLLGVETDFIDNIDHPYFETGKDVIEILTNNYFGNWRIIKPLYVLSDTYRRMMESVKNIRDVSAELIKTRVKKVKELEEFNNITDYDVSQYKAEQIGNNLLDKLLRTKMSDGNPLPLEHVMEELNLICYTSHYSTSLTISHAMHFIALYPEVQEKIFKEQQLIFEYDMYRKPSQHDLHKMKYLEAVIKETLRMKPTVSKIGRQLNGDMKLSDGRIIPSGTTVVVLYKALHMNAEFFPDPQEFQPERFFGKQRAYTSVPFSAGPRNCAGAGYAWIAMKATLSALLRRFEVRQGGPLVEPRIAYRMLTESKNGVQLQLIQRKYN